MSPLLSSPGRSIKLIEGYGTSTLGQGFGSPGGGGGGSSDSYLGDSSTNFGTSAQAILDANPERAGMNGFYWIKTTGMANAAQIFCDMNTGCHAWMRFWWYGKFEIDGSWPASNGSNWSGGTMFDVADISTITHTVQHGKGRIPQGFVPNGIMAKGMTSEDGFGNNTQRSMGQSMGAIWFDGDSDGWGDNIASTMKSAMQNGTLGSINNGQRVRPKGYCMGNIAEPGNSANCDSFYYDNSGQRFNLDDDTGFHKTIFNAGTGMGGGTTGVDFCTDTAAASYTNQLVLYFR